MNYFCIMTLVLLFIQGAAAQTDTIVDLGRYFEKYAVEGCFVICKSPENTYMRYNPKTCDSTYLPASTFKIPNSIIALEEGVIQDTLQVVRWDSSAYPVKTWNQDQTISSAMKYSCVWFYTRIAGQVGTKKYKDYVSKFQYGNMKLGNPPNSFWLSGDIRISANQQIDFLKKMYEYRLPVSKRSIDILKKIIVLERGDGYILSGKTGGVDLDEQRNIMWLVGYVERGTNVSYYALNFIINDFKRGRQVRYTLLKEILQELKLVD